MQKRKLKITWEKGLSQFEIEAEKKCLFTIFDMKNKIRGLLKIFLWSPKERN